MKKLINKLNLVLDGSKANDKYFLLLNIVPRILMVMHVRRFFFLRYPIDGKRENICIARHKLRELSPASKFNNSGADFDVPLSRAAQRLQETI